MVEIVPEPGFTAVGLFWEGSYAQAAAGEIRPLVLLVQSALPNVRQAMDREHLIGISWNDRLDGFRYFIGIRVEPDSEVPPGMSQIDVPPLRCATCNHQSGDVTLSYQMLFRWIDEHGFDHDTRVLTHLEEYPLPYVPDAPPRLRLLVPIQERP